MKRNHICVILVALLLMSNNTMASTLVVVTENANVRTGPGKGYDILGIAPKGTVINETAINGNWYKISVAGGKEGWIARSTVNIQSVSEKKCRPADAAAVATGAFGAKFGGTTAMVLCCVGTVGLGCIACVGLGIAAGAAGGAAVGETAGKAVCE